MPVAEHREFANELANLQFLLASENQSKGKTLDFDGGQLLAKLRALPAIIPRHVTNEVRLGTMAKQIKPNFSDPKAPPTWSAIGDSLFFRGRLVTDQLTREAAASGLSRDVYVEERAWIEKQKTFGKEQAGEYEVLTKERLSQRSQAERAKVEELRRLQFGSQ